ncbi:MAG: HlyD family efflux transporter periplasmic adaptor subunit [Microcella sp.]|nr:HlyD family efflux transporter periplasmic adaptor subunit [Microcella sp.]
MSTESTLHRRRRVIVIAVLALLGIAALIIGFIGRPSAPASAESLTALVESGDVSVTVSASGSLVHELVYSVSPETDPVIIERAGVSTGAGSSAPGFRTERLTVTSGQAVSEGTRLAIVLDGDDEQVSVGSPAAGTVVEVLTAAGADASTVATIGAGATLISLPVSEYDVSSIAVGQSVELQLPATEESFVGEVASIGTTAHDDGGVQRYTVLVSTDSLPDAARVGMTVSATITIDEAAGVLTVPNAAVSTFGEVSTVQIVAADGSTEVRTVELGLQGDARVEIVSGLELGDEVAIGVDGEIPADSGVSFGPGGGFGAP